MFASETDSAMMSLLHSLLERVWLLIRLVALEAPRALVTNCEPELYLAVSAHMNTDDLEP